jgi:hypothetical protein
MFQNIKKGIYYYKIEKLDKNEISNLFHLSDFKLTQDELN